MLKGKQIGLALILCLVFAITGLFSGKTAYAEPPVPILDEIPPTWSRILPADERFELVMGGNAVLDKETGLVWEQSPSSGLFNREGAQSHCNTLISGGRLGWRLPTVQELASLLDPSVLPSVPTLPIGHPFSNVVPSVYWSATTNTVTNSAWIVAFSTGEVPSGLSTCTSCFAWCVRGGQGVDPQ